MKKWIGNLLLLLLVLAGAGLMAYPGISDYYNSSRQSKAILAHDDKISRLDPMTKLRILGAADAYNDALRGEDNRFQTALEENAEKYAQCLDPTGDGSMGYIEIPSVNIKLQIFHGTEELVLSHAVGHMPGSSMPVGGKGTHAVLTGHRGLPSAKLFTDIGKLETGDRFQLNILGDILHYEIESIAIVLPDEMEGLEIVPGEDLVTLITCTPYGINSHRMLIRAHRVEPEKEPPKLVSEASRIKPATVAGCLSIPILILTALFLI